MKTSRNTFNVFSLFLILLATLASGVPAAFVPDANDSLAVDTVALEFGLVPNAALGQMTARLDVYVFNDGNAIDGMDLGFAWDNSDAVLDSVSVSSEIDSCFDLLLLTYYLDSLAATNDRRVFCATGLGGANANLPPAPQRRLWGSYFFTCQSWSAGDSLVVDTSSVLEPTKFVLYEGREEWVPYFTGAAIARDAAACCDCPTRGNVDSSADCIVTQGDLTVLIDHLMGSLAPLDCDVAGNVDLSPDGLVTMGDLTVMIDHLFITLTPLPPCP